MYRKHCSRCMNFSYSSSNMGEWHCPYCANDLTDLKAKVASHAVKYHQLKRR